MVGGALFSINFMLADELSYFDTSAETKPMLHLWSLAVEEQFYILWPMVLMVSWKFRANIFLGFFVLGFHFIFFLNISFIETKPEHTFFWSIGRFLGAVSWRFVGIYHLFLFLIFQDRKKLFPSIFLGALS